MIARLVCAFMGHRWVTYQRTFAGFVAIENYERCSRCDTKRGRA